MKIKKVPLIIIVLLIASVAFFAYNRMHKNAGALSNDQVSEIRAEVSKLMLLPEGEPVVFDITDPELMAKQQAFFAGTVAGDKLLMFATSGKAVIWSPSRGIIVNSGPIQTQATPAATTTSPTVKN